MTKPKMVTFRPLKGVRILSLALNMPGPAALMRCVDMGANCVKLDPPGADPMQAYCPQAYADMHSGVRITTADLKQTQARRFCTVSWARPMSCSPPFARLHSSSSV